MTSRPRTQGGIIDLLVCGVGRRARLRPLRPRTTTDASMNPALEELFGDGYLAITFDQPASNERYQGIVPLEGKNLADAAQAISLSPSRS